MRTLFPLWESFVKRFYRAFLLKSPHRRRGSLNSVSLFQIYVLKPCPFFPCMGTLPIDNHHDEADEGENEREIDSGHSVERAEVNDFGLKHRQYGTAEP